MQIVLFLYLIFYVIIDILALFYILYIVFIFYIVIDCIYNENLSLGLLIPILFINNLIIFIVFRKLIWKVISVWKRVSVIESYIWVTFIFIRFFLFYISFRFTLRQLILLSSCLLKKLLKKYFFFDNIYCFLSDIFI